MKNQCFNFILGFLVLLLSPLKNTFGQESHSTNTLEISANVFDFNSKEVIPYATIYNQTAGNGTISDENGFFKLSGVNPKDTILISFVGYNKKIIVQDSFNQTTFYLTPKTELLSQFVVIGDNTFLYHLVSRASKNHKTQTRTAKTYFSLESMVNNKKVEMLECYYNGQFSNRDITNLQLKQGRIALAPFGKNYYISTETSKALYMHHVFETNNHFPDSPFILSKSKLQKQYDLSIKSKYLDDDSLPIYVLNFIPKDSSLDLFEGQVWIDSLNAQVIKVNLKINDAKVHPFLPLPTVKSIERVDLYLSKTYSKLDGKMYVSSVDFNYQISYANSRNERVLASTKAVLYAYDYDTKFQLPFFHFTSGMYEDYQQINATPYNAFFWENINEFGMSEIKEANDAYAEENANITNQTAFFTHQFPNDRLFEFPYVDWSKERIGFRKTESNPSSSFSNLGSIPSEQYQLKGQVYCDINFLNDSLHVITSTIFDPYESFYYLEMDNYGKAFINMYFDLVEIYRRKFIANISNVKTVAETTILYQSNNTEMDIKTRQFFKDVSHGTNEAGMVKWNKFIYEELQIDNLTLFEIY